MNGVIYLLASLGLSGKESICNEGDMVLVSGSRRSLEKEMAKHSTILAWRNPWSDSLVGYSLWGCKSQTRLSN